MILVACGLQREAKIIGCKGVIAVAGGGDAGRLEAMLEAQAAGAIMIVSSGIAGALDPMLVVGDVVIDFKPLPSPEGEGLSRTFPHAHFGAIIGQDHIAVSIAEKAALAASGALAVDMESHIAARVAARHGLPFLAIRTISDTAHETLPPAALVGMNPDGSMALGKVLASLARRPGQLPALIRTGRSAELAFKSLVEIHQKLAPLWATLLAQGSV
ncbi:phosphorylase [Sphingomonas sp. 28-63-12]|uniref:phosphorylase family protein n=1 Tax=Sphingomonas sp. 28-63-12 TaxID=1970434 RepID=UPI0035A95738